MVHTKERGAKQATQKHFLEQNIESHYEHCGMVVEHLANLLFPSRVQQPGVNVMCNTCYCNITYGHHVTSSFQLGGPRMSQDFCRSISVSSLDECQFSTVKCTFPQFAFLYLLSSRKSMQIETTRMMMIKL